MQALPVHGEMTAHQQRVRDAERALLLARVRHSMTKDPARKRARAREMRAAKRARDQLREE
jgi:hypothetical protein